MNNKRFTYHKGKISNNIPRINQRKIMIFFKFNSGDEYMRRAFLRRGWIEDSSENSDFFNIRWDLNENSVFYFMIFNR